MTNIQLKEVAIYSIDGSERRIIPFEIGKLNIIYGASQTGKSAIIPIIDYCLCSKTNRIPAGTIRENCSAFAISLYLGNQYLLIKRIGDSDPQKILYAYSEQSLRDFNEDNWLTTTREKFKLHLNNALGISFSEIAQTAPFSKQGIIKSCPSTRSPLMAAKSEPSPTFLLSVNIFLITMSASFSFPKSLPPQAPAT